MSAFTQLHENRKRKLESMLNGFDTPENYFKNNPLGIQETIIVLLLTLVTILLKYTINPFLRLTNSSFDPKKNMNAVSNLKLVSQGDTNFNPGEFALSKEDINDFEKKGIYGPFRLIGEAEAEELFKHVNNEYEKGTYHKNCPLGQEFVDALGKDPSINFVGLYSANYDNKIKELLSRQEIAHRLKSLLGSKIKCWRSQFFQKLPGSDGTFWHQSGTFRESSEKQKLSPPEGYPIGMNSLTVWIALTPSTIENGCLRILEGSHVNGFFEQFAGNVLDNKFGYLMSLPPNKIKGSLKTLLYTPGSLLKVQMVFMEFIKYFPDYLDNFDPVSIELKPGEAVLFSTLNTHGSFANCSKDTRLGLVGRYCADEIGVYQQFPEDKMSTPVGAVKFSTDKLNCFNI